MNNTVNRGPQLFNKNASGVGASNSMHSIEKELRREWLGKRKKGGRGEEGGGEKEKEKGKEGRGEGFSEGGKKGGGTLKSSLWMKDLRAAKSKTPFKTLR